MEIGERVSCFIQQMDEELYERDPLKAISEAKTKVEHGVYEGNHPCEYLGGMENPRIKLDNGETMWGCLCWWGPEKKDA